MPGSKSRPSLKEVRVGLKSVQTEGERLLSRIRRDAAALVVWNSPEVVSNLLTKARGFHAALRQHAERMIRDLETRRRQILVTLEKQASSLIDAVGKRFNVASREGLVSLDTRVIELREQLDDALAKIMSTPSSEQLEHLHERIAALEQKLDALSEENVSKAF